MFSGLLGATGTLGKVRFSEKPKRRSLLDEYRSWREWKLRKKHEKVDYTLGCGYYPAKTGFERWKEMKSGRMCLCRCISATFYNDPKDMIKESEWQIIRYAGEPRTDTMTWREYRRAEIRHEMRNRNV